MPAPFLCVLLGQNLGSLVAFHLVEEALDSVAEVQEAGFAGFHHVGEALHLATQVAIAVPPRR